MLCLDSDTEKRKEKKKVFSVCCSSLCLPVKGAGRGVNRKERKVLRVPAKSFYPNELGPQKNFKIDHIRIERTFQIG
jgi:hypothetical protein